MPVGVAISTGFLTRALELFHALEALWPRRDASRSRRPPSLDRSQGAKRAAWTCQKSDGLRYRSLLVERDSLATCEPKRPRRVSVQPRS